MSIFETPFLMYYKNLFHTEFETAALHKIFVGHLKRQAFHSLITAGPNATTVKIKKESEDIYSEHE